MNAPIRRVFPTPVANAKVMDRKSRSKSVQVGCATFLESIAGGMDDGEHLVIACCSYDKGVEKMNPHITVKKIPQMLLDKCEFDKSDYNLNIINPPVYDDEEDCNE